MASEDETQIHTHFHKQDVRRAREFYRYLEPHNLLHPSRRRKNSTFDSHHQHIPSLTSALSPYCQLTALRCNAKKAMLNFMDRDTMYFLSEAMRQTAVREGNEIYEFIDDPILMSCSAVPLEGRICELTVRLDEGTSHGRRPMFVIPDLLNSQFSHLSIIAGPPYYRFYAGTPIISSKGVNIGSLAIMDDKPRTGLTDEEEEFLSTTAAQIMQYMETNRQAIEGRRARRLAQGLESFIAGKNHIDTNDDGDICIESPNQYGIAFAPDYMSHNAQGNGDMSKPDVSGGEYQSGNLGPSQSRAKMDRQPDEHLKKGNVYENDSNSHTKIFSRAANLLHQSLNLGEDGNIAFFDTGKRLAGTSTKRATYQPGRSNVSNESSTSDDDIGSKSSQASPVSYRPATIVAQSNNDMQPVSDASLEPSTALAESFLQELAKRYSAGKIWSLDDPQSSSSEDDLQHEFHKPSTEKEPSRSKHRRREVEATTVKRAFPYARQVIFLPIYDVSTATFSHCLFIASAINTRTFDNSDTSFLHAFCSTVMGEIIRKDALLADKQKSDFVGTISHEMRSPLHGVLASVEFLAESDLTSFQKSLVDTIDSCGKTLLDTINHVLDYSKVNSFQRQWEATNKKTPLRRNHFLGPDNTSTEMSNGAPPLLQLFAVTDIAAISEEVVDGLALGQTYRSGIDITDVSQEARGKRKGGTAFSRTPEATRIIVDVQPANWSFLTQPGALRRIIMNVTGNAIKYTLRGNINVKLELRENLQEHEPYVMVFTVSDTGKGISPQFLASRLFVPFAQENALAPGTGLGLSIVHSIVTMLGGSINIKSTVGVGTTVEVVLPLKRPLPGQMSANHTPGSAGTTWSNSSASDDSISILQNQASDHDVAYYKPSDSSNGDQVRVVSMYLKEWYHLNIIQLPQFAAVIITDEEDFESLLESVVSTPGNRPAIVVLCGVESRNSITNVQKLERQVGSAVEFIAKPFGPHKLARSLRAVLEKKRIIKSNNVRTLSLDSIKEVSGQSTSESESGKICEDLSEMDLSSPGDLNPANLVQASENLAISQTRSQGQMALNSPTAEKSLKSPGARVSEGSAFPFPEQEQEESRRRRESYRGAESLLEVEQKSTQTSNVRSNVSVPTQESTKYEGRIDPQVLLVDDNMINLKLLETFLTKKRNYSNITKTEDGQQAVDAVVATSTAFDVIFMDISMPIMNGFEATRAIREHEERKGVNPGAMIIALTGLASGKDQRDGFESGCDIYMTKPVSFKEVTKLLDNWEAHQKLGKSLRKESVS